MFKTQAPVGQLVVGETPVWYTGVCKIVGVRKDSHSVSLDHPPHYLKVVGESGHSVGRVKLTVNCELDDVDNQLYELVQDEMEAL